MSRIQLLLIIVATLVIVPDTRGQNSASTSAGVISPTTNAEEILLRPAQEPSEATTSKPQTRSTGHMMTTIVGALAVCLGAFFLLVWVTKRHAPAGMAALPKEVIESLGRSSLNGRQHLQLLRVGRKLVLLHVTPTGAEALTEIVDPAEVDRLVGLCQQTKATSVTASFRDVLTHYEKVPADKGFLGDASQSDWELATRSGRNRTTRREELDA